MANSLWPVEPHETKKVVPMIAMSFLICFNYTLLRDLKDILVLEKMEPSALSGLKLYCTMPLSIVFMLVYTKMSLKLTKPQLFYYCMGFFLAFFGLYMGVMLPFQDYIEMGASWGKDTADATSIKFFSTFIYLFANWTTALMYVMSELWGTVVLSVLFWGFANDICRTSEAKRFYTLFNIGANVSLLFCGSFLITMSTFMPATDEKKKDATDSNLMLYIIMGAVNISILIIVGIYRWMQTNVLSDPRLCPPKEDAPTKKKVKLGFFESLKVLFTDSYILLIAVMVLMYGVSVNLVELYFKASWAMEYPNRKGKMWFTGIFSCGTGIVSLFLLIFIGGKSIRVLGWTKTALITPIVLVCSGLPLLFLFSVKKYFVTAIPTSVLVVVGYIAVVGSKSCKYSFFDPVKEMSYIPLGENRGRAKAAVDVVGARGGKSLGSVLVQAFNLIYNDSNCRTYVETVCSFLMTGVLTWTVGTVALGKRYNAKVKEQTAAVELGGTTKA